MATLDHYQGARGAEYFEFRKARRDDNTQRSRAKIFQDWDSAGRVVLDFGCGTGAVLAELPAAQRIGVEIGELAALEARTRLDRVVPTLAEIADEAVDLVISCHALEHVESPIHILRELRRVLRPGGKIRVVVPSEMAILSPAQRVWSADDMNKHLFTWTPQILGNAMTAAGFEVEDAHLRAASNGSRLLNHLGPLVGRTGKFLKALRAERFEAVVTAVKPS